jgi:dienelactone hydrolase
MKSETVRIPTSDGMLAGSLLQPASLGYTPAVVMDADLSARNNSVAQWMASELAQRGWAVLLFDHAGFGNSGGAPGVLNWPAQVHALESAYWWLRRRRGIDGNRVGIWACGLGVWRTLTLLEKPTDIKAAVLVDGLIRQRSWFRPDHGLKLLLDIGFFDGDSSSAPLLDPRWMPAWLQLLKAPLPKPDRQNPTHLMHWQRSGGDALPPGWQKRIEPNRLEQHTWPDTDRLTGDAKRTGAIVLPGQPDPVATETHAFLLQHL